MEWIYIAVYWWVTGALSCWVIMQYEELDEGIAVMIFALAGIFAPIMIVIGIIVIAPYRVMRHLTRG